MEPSFQRLMFFSLADPANDSGGKKNGVAKHKFDGDDHEASRHRDQAEKTGLPVQYGAVNAADTELFLAR